MPIKFSEIILQSKPLYRLIISILFAFLVLLAFGEMPWQSITMAVLGWDLFGLFFLLLEWLILSNKKLKNLSEIGIMEDGSTILVLALIIISIFGSVLLVLILALQRNQNTLKDAYYLPLVIVGIVLSWLMLHTIFTFHYARLYYAKTKEGIRKGINFPEERDEEVKNFTPEYLEFIYFSFGIGCSFQVSDMEVSSRKIRKVVFIHSLLSFWLNTFIVALTINIVSNL